MAHDHNRFHAIHTSQPLTVLYQLEFVWSEPTASPHKQCQGTKSLSPLISQPNFSHCLYPNSYCMAATTTASMPKGSCGAAAGSALLSQHCSPSITRSMRAARAGLGMSKQCLDLQLRHRSRVSAVCALAHLGPQAGTAKYSHMRCALSAGPIRTAALCRRTPRSVPFPALAHQHVDPIQCCV